MPLSDPAFKGAGASNGLEIWRIKDFKLVLVQKNEYGTFFSGDSYIILYTYGTGNKKEHNVHFWLGAETSQDEAGTAAIKTVELDDLLGGAPVQYREIQNHESSLFHSYFKKGIKYLKGGYDSGFTHVGTPQFKTRLFQCKGKRNVRVIEVDIARSSLNKGDVFILDEGLTIYVWMPPECGRSEKIKGIELARNIRDQERSGRAQMELLDSDWDTNEEFWSKLGGKGPVKSASEGGSDEDFLTTVKPVVSLWRVSDASGQMKVDCVAKGELSGDSLDPKDAFILDVGDGGLFVWIGKGCTMDERKKAMIWAAEYLKQNNRPPWSQVIRVLEGAEPQLFTQWFQKPSQERVWTSAAKKLEPHLFHCSDASGKLRVEEISNFTQDDLEPDDVMILDGGNVIYEWIGSGSTDLEKKAGRLIAQKYLENDAKARPASAKIVKIEQGQEPSDFIQHFPKWQKDHKGRQLEAEVMDCLKSLKM